MARRLKTVGNVSSTTTSEKWVTPPGGSSYSEGDRITKTDQGYYSHIGHDSPDYGARKREGRILPMTYWSQYEVTGHATGSMPNQTNPNGYVGWIVGNYILYEDWIINQTSLEHLIEDLETDHLIQGAAAAIYSSGFDGLTFIAELHKVVRMFRGFIKRNLKNAASGQLYRNWLEGRYGWRILMYELMDIHQVLTSFDESRERYKQSIGYTTKDVTSASPTVTLGDGTHHYSEIVETTISVRGTVVMDLKPPKFAFNPITTAWELIPYSFVIDWIIGIGNWLESLSALSLSTDHTAAAGFQITMDKYVEYSHSVTVPGWTVERTHSSEARASHTLRYPGKVSNLPQLGSGLDELKVLDLVALILQALKR